MVGLEKMSPDSVSANNHNIYIFNMYIYINIGTTDLVIMLIDQLGHTEHKVHVVQDIQDHLGIAHVS